MIRQFDVLKRKIFFDQNIRIERTIDNECIVLSGNQKLLKVHSDRDVSNVYIWDNKENRFNPIATTQADLQKDNLFGITARDIFDMYYKCMAMYATQGLPDSKVLPRALTASEKVVVKCALSSLRQR